MSTNINEAKNFCLDVEKLALKYNLPFFVVTDGASMTRNENCEAVLNARQKHVEWEKKHNIDSDEDWIEEKK